MFSLWISILVHSDRLQINSAQNHAFFILALIQVNGNMYGKFQVAHRRSSNACSQDLMTSIQVLLGTHDLKPTSDFVLWETHCSVIYTHWSSPDHLLLFIWNHMASHGLECIPWVGLPWSEWSVLAVVSISCQCINRSHASQSHHTILPRHFSLQIRKPTLSENAILYRLTLKS